MTLTSELRAQPTTPAVQIVPTPADDPAGLARLVDAVIVSRPEYAPSVVEGPECSWQWFTKKHLDISLLALDQHGETIGHVGVRRWAELPDGATLPADRSHELCRLMVHPDHQGQGVGSTLIESVEFLLGDRLWATCHQFGPSRRLLRSLGWSVHTEGLSWPDDPGPGSCLLSPASPANLRSITP